MQLLEGNAETQDEHNVVANATASDQTSGPVPDVALKGLGSERHLPKAGCTEEGCAR